MGKAFFVITLLVLPVLVPPHSPPACRDLVPDQCQAIPLSEFCRGRHQHCSCSQICKDLNNHLPRHKKAPNSLGTPACWYIWGCAPGRGSLPEAYLPEPQSLGSHRIPLPPPPGLCLFSGCQAAGTGGVFLVMGPVYTCPDLTTFFSFSLK